MPTTKVVLVKKTAIDSVITAVETRQLRGPSALAQPQAGMRDMFEKAIADFEALTQMKVQDGIAIIPINGPISFDDPFAAFFGETTVKTVSANIDRALADASVHSILFNVNSPGGYVTGVEALSDKIYKARGTKRLYAHTEGMAASAAYWIASAADKVFLGSGTAEVGSIGVYLVHFDYSGLLTDMGVKVTEITAGEYKGLGSPYTELSDTDQKLLQADVDYIYTRFVEAVARNRGISSKEVLKSANGLTYFGADAVAKSLADGISTQQEVIAMTKEEKDKLDQEAAAKAKADKEAAEAKAAADKKAADDKAAAEAAAERERINAAAVVKPDAAAVAAAETEGKAAYKAAFGREATAEEVAFYVAQPTAGRDLIKRNLTETAENRKKLATKAGLFTEVAGDGAAPDDNKDGGLLGRAAMELGHIPKS